MKKSINFVLCLVSVVALLFVTTPKAYISKVLPVGEIGTNSTASIPLPYNDATSSLAVDDQTDTELAAVDVATN